MKKRIVLLAMALLIALLPLAAFAEGTATVKDKMASRSGPGTKYSEELGTLDPGLEITVLGQMETNGTRWYHVEFSRSGKLYRCYILTTRIDVSGSVPWENDAYVEDVTLRSTTAYYGPGEHYASRRPRLDANTAVKVFAVEGEWALCEFRDDWRWAQGYVNVADLRNTEAGALPLPTAEPWPTLAPVPSYVVDEATQAPAYEPPVSGPVCTDYYGNTISCAGRGDNFPKLAASLPVLNYFDGVPCVADAPVYSGPGAHYYQRKDTDPAAFRGILDTNLRVFGQENGWIMIRYPSDIYGGARYGWAVASAISADDLSRIPPISFAYLPAAVTNTVLASDNPDSAVPDGVTIMQNSGVTALAFLDAQRQWVLCEYGMWDGINFAMARGFLPADSLLLQ